MTWEELCAKAKKMGYVHCFDDHYEHCEELDGLGLSFLENGKIKNYVGDLVSENKSVEQMYAIMEALIDKDISVPSKGENERLQKKIDIATKALEAYARGGSDAGNGCLYEMPAPSLAQKALKEMEEV